jgi:hypothetical protein
MAVAVAYACCNRLLGFVGCLRESVWLLRNLFVQVSRSFLAKAHADGFQIAHDSSNHSISISGVDELGINNVYEPVPILIPLKTSAYHHESHEPGNNIPISSRQLGIISSEHPIRTHIHTTTHPAHEHIHLAWRLCASAIWVGREMKARRHPLYRPIQRRAGIFVGRSPPLEGRAKERFSVLH